MLSHLLCAPQSFCLPLQYSSSFLLPFFPPFFLSFILIHPYINKKKKVEKKQKNIKTVFLSKFLNAEELSFVINYGFDNIYYLFLHPVHIKVFIVKSL